MRSYETCLNDAKAHEAGKHKSRPRKHCLMCQQERHELAAKEAVTKYVVRYGDHDSGANVGSLVRQGKATAERTARLLKECGYRQVIVELE